MGRDTVSAEIDRLDQLSRTRALCDIESARLSRLITVERRYRYGSMAANSSRALRVPTPDQSIAIGDRIDATIGSMVQEGLGVRAIYLTIEHLGLAEAEGLVETKVGPSERTCRGYPLRHSAKAKRSLIYSTHGVARAVRRFA